MMKRKFFTYLLHIALMIILIGACVTHFWGEQGEVHLRADQAQSIKTRHSTLHIFLWDFRIEYAKDGETVVDYVSDIKLMERTQKATKLKVDEGSIRMNKPLKYHHYRLCQADYDSDMQGVVLRYNYDPWGIGLTYTGYGLLLVAIIGFFFQKSSYFKGLLLNAASKTGIKKLLIALPFVIVCLAVVMTYVVMPKPPLQPILQTPFLGIHVSVIMLAYTLFAVILVNGCVGLFAAKLRERMMHLSQILLYPAVFCLAIGIFIGAVWANLSWGRYWGWDPKETWALITMLVYAVLLHWYKLNTHHIAHKKNALIFHICSIVAFIFVLFTYFGVNYFLGGLHSYA